MVTHRDYVMREVKKTFDALDLKGKKILEIGPRDDDTFRKYFEEKGAEWFGCDIDERITQDKVDICSMDNLVYGDNSFDIIFSCHAWEHCPNPLLALLEMKRVCKDMIWLATPSPCRHQILEGDFDHIFVLSPMHMERLFTYIGVKVKSFLQTDNIPIEQDYNVITIGNIGKGDELNDE